MPSAAPTFSDLSNTTISVTTTSGADGFYMMDDMEQLRSVASSTGNKVATVKDTGDGSFGIYTWNATSVDADNGLSIIAPDDGGVGRWVKGV